MRKRYRMPEMFYGEDKSVIQSLKNAGELVLGWQDPHSVAMIYHVGDSTIKYVGVNEKTFKEGKERVYLNGFLNVTSRDEGTCKRDLETVLNSIKENIPNYNVKGVEELTN
ncbi:MAG TPA: hypothetical protein HA282_05295 [Nanoarchaeota archaeon]|nr:MAG: hypothetical protein QT01_C0001G0169 [archaeon GW2011_AR6]HIH17596.1 hypothetical protein [Nanoarchaeota archaeon]HIH33877.1 hypothetical protein [Nanoarchaeota archaeon]HIH51081.1 hypothetical protein [Nanoarchaeota archaeon]HIH66597.1 hypothetical protein [Nanoarchaeota archaeon]